jgi:CPA1 family monovalent cation:H+ antiporter
VIIGLNFHTVISSIDSNQFIPLMWYSLLIALWALVMRMAIVFVQAWHRQNIYRRFPTEINSKKRLSRQSSLVISWAGMRWIISLATALAIPLTLSDGTQFPQRDVIIFISVMVVLLTLIIQWLWLPYLVNYLHITKRQQQ